MGLIKTLINWDSDPDIPVDSVVHPEYRDAPTCPCWTAFSGSATQSPGELDKLVNLPVLGWSQLQEIGKDALCSLGSSGIVKMKSTSMRKTPGLEASKYSKFC